MLRPEADISVTTNLVRELLEDQHPDLASLELRPFDEGWDNVLYRLGDHYVVRLPRREVAVSLLDNELKWLPTLASQLSLKVSAALRAGQRSARFNYPWSINQWCEGVPADLSEDINETKCAELLGEFLRSLHSAAPVDAPQNPLRGCALEDRAGIFRQRSALLDGQLDLDAATRAFDRGVAASRWTSELRWLHGDMHPGNLLVRDGVLSAVVDFGDMCAGDPATDIAGAWMLVGDDHLNDFFRAYGDIDDALYARALGWAALFGVFFVGIGLEGRTSYERVGRLTLQRVERSLR
jgi:aminoglycoside phosphotransferase (APT) family kinase protein